LNQRQQRMLHFSHFHLPSVTPRQLVLATGFAMSGGWAWWHLHTVPAPVTAPPRPRLPDHHIWQLTAVETDANGQPQRQLSVSQVQHFVAENLSELTQPRVTLLHATDGKWTARADQGLIFQSGAQIRLLGNVEINRAAVAHQRPLQLFTTQLDLWREQALAATEQPVRIISGADTLTAPTLQLWYAHPARLTFHGRTQLQITPAAAPAPPSGGSPL